VSEFCEALHQLARRGTRRRFPFDRRALPANGIRQSGLWLVNELFKQPMNGADLRRLTDALI
jgi:hypothetical protein